LNDLLNRCNFSSVNPPCQGSISIIFVNRYNDPSIVTMI
jgi:hypothetical protein